MKQCRSIISSACRWALAVIVFAACGEATVNMPPGPDGDRGKDGLAAYDLWKNGLKDGTITDWDKTKDTEADFAKYLQGRDGQNGRDGVDGRNGESAYEMWKRMVETAQVDDPHHKGQKWPAERTSVQDFWRFLTGASGEEGQVPRIGEDGYWYIGNTKTAHKARGEKGDKGQDAQAPVVTINDAGNWVVNGQDTGVRAAARDGKDGENGKSPVVTINDQGMWVIDGTATTTKAKGEDGKTPEITINEKKNWAINGVDTKIPAFGAKGDKGEDGIDGKNAYELWKDYIATGKVDNPHNVAEKWLPEKNTEEDFWYFLSGYNLVEVDKRNSYVIAPQPAHEIDGEGFLYVDRDRGAVRYVVLRNGRLVGAGYKVSKIPLLCEPWSENVPLKKDIVFTTDKNGEIFVPAAFLPNHKQENELKTAGTAMVQAPGSDLLVESKPVQLCNRVNVRVKIVSAKPNTNVSEVTVNTHGAPSISIEVEVERETANGQWVKFFPRSAGKPWEEVQSFCETYKVKDPGAKMSLANLQIAGVDPKSPNKSKRRWFSQSPTKYKGDKNTASGSLFVTRPRVYHEDEKNVVGDKALEVANLVGVYKWDEKDNYVSVATTPEFGRRWAAETMVFMPEVYPAPEMLEASLRIDDTDKGKLILFGEVDKNTFNPFYLTMKSQTDSRNDEQIKFVLKDDKWVPNPDQGAAEPNGRFSKDQYTKLGQKTAVGFKVNTPTGSYVYKSTAPLIEHNFKFMIDGLAEGREIYMRSVYNKQSTHEWRDRPAYILRKDADGNYYLESYYKSDKHLKIKKEKFDEAWLKKPSDLQPVPSPAP